ncbi:MAG: hypothetical protein ACTS8P_01490 [Arsenophonus sp. NC-XBC3-MAG3]
MIYVERQRRVYHNYDVFNVIKKLPIWQRAMESVVFCVSAVVGTIWHSRFNSSR